MAGRRNLKKTAHTDVEGMFSDLFALHAVTSEERRSTVEELISRVIDSENDFITHISYTDGRGEAKLVHKYYSELQEEYLYFANEVEGEVDKFGDKLLTPETWSADEASASHTVPVWLTAR